MRPLPIIAATLGIAAIGAAIPAAAQQPTPGYHVASKVKLGRDGGWDYLVVDTVGQRVFISRGTHTLVVDARTDSVVGDILDTPGVHGIALAWDLGRGYTSNGRDSTIGPDCTIGPFACVPAEGIVPEGSSVSGNVTSDVSVRSGR